MLSGHESIESQSYFNEKMASSEKEQITIITKHFTKAFMSEEKEVLPIIPPTEMTVPFTKTEIQKAAKSKKNQ